MAGEKDIGIGSYCFIYDFVVQGKYAAGHILHYAEGVAQTDVHTLAGCICSFLHRGNSQGFVFKHFEGWFYLIKSYSGVLSIL